jgi:hypothetical protein
VPSGRRRGQVELGGEALRQVIGNLEAALEAASWHGLVVLRR